MLTRYLARLTREALYLERRSQVVTAVIGVHLVFRVLMPASWLALIVSWWPS